MLTVSYVYEESIKGAVGRAGPKVMDKGKKIGEDIANIPNSDSPKAKAVQNTVLKASDKLDKAATGAAKKIVSVSDKFSKKEDDTKKKPVKMVAPSQVKALKEKLNKASEKVLAVRDAIVTGTCMIAGVIAIGPLDIGLKMCVGLASAASKAKGDDRLSAAYAKALVPGAALPVVAIKSAIDILRNKKKGDVLTPKEKKETTSAIQKLADTLEKWANSDKKLEAVAMVNPHVINEMTEYMDQFDLSMNVFYESINI